MTFKWPKFKWPGEPGVRGEKIYAKITNSREQEPSVFVSEAGAAQKLAGSSALLRTKIDYQSQLVIKRRTKEFFLIMKHIRISRILFPHQKRKSYLCSFCIFLGALGDFWDLKQVFLFIPWKPSTPKELTKIWFDNKPK